MSRNYGEQFVDQVRDYLTANNLKSLGAINSTVLADLAQRFYEKYTGAQKKAKKMVAEEEWLKSIEADATFAGIDVRREFGKCQFWCKERGLVATRRRFTNWLLKVDPAVGDYSGASSKPRSTVTKPRFTVETPVPGWPMLVRNHVCLNNPEAEVDFWCSGDWSDLPVEIRQKVIEHA